MVFAVARVVENEVNLDGVIPEDGELGPEVPFPLVAVTVNV